MCKATTKEVHIVGNESARDEQPFFIGTIGSKQVADKDWYVNFQINNCTIPFKIDTGAQCNVMPWAVVYASRALNSAERNYAQIEKEMLAIVFGTNKFHQYIYGKQVSVETDHKSLESLFEKPHCLKHLSAFKG